MPGSVGLVEAVEDVLTHSPQLSPVAPRPAHESAHEIRPFPLIAMLSSPSFRLLAELENEPSMFTSLDLAISVLMGMVRQR